jgi:hypothetical protein
MDQDIDLQNLLVTFVHIVVWRWTARYLQLVTNCSPQTYNAVAITAAIGAEM